MSYSLHEAFDMIINYLCNIDLPDNCFNFSDNTVDLHTFLFNVVKQICEYPPQPQRLYYCYVDFDDMTQYGRYNIDVSGIYQEISNYYENLQDHHVSAFCMVEMKSFITACDGARWVYDRRQGEPVDDPVLWMPNKPLYAENRDFLPTLGDYAFIRYNVGHRIAGDYDPVTKEISLELGPQGLVVGCPEHPTNSMLAWATENSVDSRGYETGNVPDVFMRNYSTRGRVSYRIHIFAGHVHDVISRSCTWMYQTDVWPTTFDEGQDIPVTTSPCIVATGGNEQDIDINGVPHKCHYFTSTGSQQFVVDYVPHGHDIYVYVIGAGGGGGTSAGGSASGGGGGGGEIRSETGVSVSTGTYDIYVGAGGSGASANNDQDGGDGEASEAFGITAAGGGGGGGRFNDGRSGGCGGGSGARTGFTGGGSATGLGYPGGDGGRHDGSRDNAPGGGGGMGSAGQDGNDNSYGGDGGDGIYIGDDIGDNYGDNGWFCAGGGGGITRRHGSRTPGSGGQGGGGDGGYGFQTGLDYHATNGQTNSGSGGGGGGKAANAGDGGSGLVVICYECDPSSTVT